MKDEIVMKNYKHINIHFIYDNGYRASDTDEELAKAFPIWGPPSADFLQIIREALDHYDNLLVGNWTPGEKLPIYHLVVPPTL